MLESIGEYFENPAPNKIKPLSAEQQLRRDAYSVLSMLYYEHQLSDAKYLKEALDAFNHRISTVSHSKRFSIAPRNARQFFGKKIRELDYRLDTLSERLTKPYPSPEAKKALNRELIFYPQFKD